MLIGQAVYVRYATPRLPEPGGERSGVAGSGPLLNLLILGDSAAAGVGVSTQMQALSGQLTSTLGAHFRVNWKLVAQTGLKAKNVLAALEMRDSEVFDVAVTSIGVNDVTHATGVAKWIGQERRIIDTLLFKFKARHIILSSIPPMHLFPALPQPLRWYFGRRAKRFNAALCDLADCYRECEFLNIDFSPDQAIMADDGFHPGAPAYRLWAEHVAASIQNRWAEENYPHLK